MYFTAPHPTGEGRQHFWRYYDLTRREIIDNRYQIMQIIGCGPEAPRFPPPYGEVDIYDIQERVIADILQVVSQQQSMALAPKIVAPEQVTIAELLREHIASSITSREEVRELRRFLKQPLPGAYVKRLRGGLGNYTKDRDLTPLLAIVRELQQAFGAIVSIATPLPQIDRDDLHLVCFEYVSS